MPATSAARGPIRDVAIFFVGFAAVRTADVIVAWRLLTWSFVSVFIEELVFRGVVQTRLAEGCAAPLAILAAAALFLLIHVPGWTILGLPADGRTAVSIFLDRGDLRRAAPLVRQPVARRRGSLGQQSRRHAVRRGLSIFMFEHDLFRKPVSTFQDHALGAVASETRSGSRP
jgi:hypothetical protein